MSKAYMGGSSYCCGAPIYLGRHVTHQCGGAYIEQRCDECGQECRSHSEMEWLRKIHAAPHATEKCGFCKEFCASPR